MKVILLSRSLTHCTLFGDPVFLWLAAVLTVLAARQHRFQKYRKLKVLGIYLLSLGVGIGVLIVDGLLHPAAVQNIK